LNIIIKEFFERFSYNFNKFKIKEFLQSTLGNGGNEQSEEKRNMVAAKEMEKRYKREFKGLYLNKENVCGSIFELNFH
jgi:hypothetical protein